MRQDFETFRHVVFEDGEGDQDLDEDSVICAGLAVIAAAAISKAASQRSRCSDTCPKNRKHRTATRTHEPFHSDAVLIASLVA